MKKTKRRGAKAAKKLLGFTLMEVMVGVAVFTLFAFGVYEGVRYIYKVVYMSRVRIVETAVLSEQLETVRNMRYEDIGIAGGIPAGKLEHTRDIVRDNITYNLVTTVRNIDDSYDGTITSTPQDTAPADYKLVEMSIICPACFQQEPVILNTVISPNGLENASYNGALFIQVFDAAGAPIGGATVNVTRTDITPPITVEDTTDIEGWLRIVDTPTGTQDYQIVVEKEGYSSDYTVSTTPDRTKPKKPHSTVVTRSATESFFSIDRLANIVVHTINQGCSAVASREFNIWGEKLIGLDPPEPKYSGTFTTDSGGDYSISNIEWDKYFFDSKDTSYDVAGTIPILPLSLDPGATQEIYLIQRAHTAHSLLVGVKHGGTGLPLSDVTVRLYGNGYDHSIVTGLGYIRQTDWSGGNGQLMYTDENEYYADDSNIEAVSFPGDLKLKEVGGFYLSSGWLESSTFDLGESVNFQNIIWEPLNQPAEAGENPVRFQLAASNSSSPASWDFIGPDGASDTFYTATSTVIYSGHDGKRYLRYKVYLSTEDDGYTPQLSEVAITYNNTCVPPGQSYFYGLSQADYTYEISRDGYQTATGTVSVDGYTTLAALLVSE